MGLVNVGKCQGQGIVFGQECDLDVVIGSSYIWIGIVVGIQIS